MWLLASIALGADCGFTASLGEIDESLAGAEASYAELDTPGFRQANDALRALLPCVADPLPAATIARLNRVRGLALFSAGEKEQATMALTAAKELDSAYVFSEELLPPGYPLRTTYEALKPEPTLVPLKQPKGVTLWLDGEVSTERPTHRPTVFQVGQDGSVQQTTVLWPSDPVPPYPVVPKLRNGLALASGVLVAGAAGLYGGAWASRGKLGTAVGEEEVLKVQSTTNTLGALSVVTLGLAAGTGAAAVAVGPR